MNAMVGMQPHQGREDSLRDLMKTDDPIMGAFDEGNELDDDFNAEALLMSPMFNDSGAKLDHSFTNDNENEFGQFEEPHDTLLGRVDRSAVPPPAMDYSEPPRPPMRPAIVRESRTVKLPTVSQAMQGMQTMGIMGQHHHQQPPPQQQQLPLPSSFAGYGGNNSNSNMGIAGYGGNNSNSNMGMSVPSVIGDMNGSFRQVTDDSSHFDQSQSDLHDYSAQSYRSPTRRLPDRSISSNSSYSYQSESDSPVLGRSASSMYQQGGQQHHMLTPGRSLPMKAQSYGGAMMGGGHSNDLSIMRQQLQRMRDLEIRDAMQQSQSRRTSDSSNLTSQSMHLPVQRTASANACLSRSMHFEPGQGSFSSMLPGGPPMAGGNVSIASDSRSFKPSFNQFDGTSMQGASNVNEAMEKLCESMKRSAMSRSLVKQYSSGGRGVSRHGSGSLYAMRQASGRNNNNNMDDSSGRSVPIRRLSSTKHHLQHPVRGVYRHDSAKSAGHHSLNFQINMDGRNMGL